MEYEQGIILQYIYWNTDINFPSAWKMAKQLDINLHYGIWLLYTSDLVFLLAKIRLGKEILEDDLEGCLYGYWGRLLTEVFGYWGSGVVYVYWGRLLTEFEGFRMVGSYDMYGFLPLEIGGLGIWVEYGKLEIWLAGISFLMFGKLECLL